MPGNKIAKTDGLNIDGAGGNLFYQGGKEVPEEPRLLVHLAEPPSIFAI